MKSITTTVFLFLAFCLQAQTIINGKVTNTKGNAIIGANVYLENTYDGATTDEKGNFSFKTDEKSIQTLIISFLTYETYKQTGEVSSFKDLKIVLEEAKNALDVVELNAGSFQAGGTTKASVMSPLDVVTTAGSMGDFIGALQTLPGTQAVAEDGRLFVRGGTADETKIFIDGLSVFQPYTPTTNNTPTRGRYSPFLFDGITFSTGGYSAEYGNALSSVLLLNTIKEPRQNETNISIMSLGGGISKTKKWEKDALTINATYINLAPYNGLVPDNNKWNKLPESISGEAVYRHKTKTGLLKFYSAFDYSNFDVEQQNINFENRARFDLKNNNWYSNLSYHGKFTNKTKITAGVSYSNSKTDLFVISTDLTNKENAFHAKLKFHTRFNNFFRLNYGAETISKRFTERGVANNEFPFRYAFTDNRTSAFAEADIRFTNDLALKAGLRVNYTALFDETNIAPRVALAYRLNKSSQFSLAYGDFYQTGQNDELKFKPNLKNQRATHYIANFQYNKNNRLFRMEGYYKDYDKLWQYDVAFDAPVGNFSNNGFGYAKGLDLFYRDSRTIKNLQYWFSYSYIDTERQFKNYPKAVQPSFATNHNASLVTKYWVSKWRTQLGATYTFASGRPYNNPNTSQFMSGRTKTFNDLSVNVSYLISQQKILFFSATNVLGFNNVFGYDYANSPNVNGIFNRQAVIPAAKRFFFVGFFWTISDDKTKNQLDNL